MSTKCKINGEAITVKHKIIPVPGTVRVAVAGEFKGSTIAHPDRAGECPECRGYVPLSTGGYVTSHIEHNEPAPAPVALSEPTVIPVDTGVRTGDPADGMGRRTTEIDGAFERGTVQLPGRDDKGRRKMVDVPATVENIRAAVAYWRKRQPRSDAGRAEQTRMVLELIRRARAAEAGTAPLDADQSPEGRTAQMSPGPALVRGRSETPFAGEVTVRKVGDAYERPAPAEDKRRSKAGTMAGPLGRPRFDRQVTEVKPKRTAAERRRYRRAQQNQANQGK